MFGAIFSDGQIANAVSISFVDFFDRGVLSLVGQRSEVGIVERAPKLLFKERSASQVILVGFFGRDFDLVQSGRIALGKFNSRMHGEVMPYRIAFERWHLAWHFG